MAEETTIKVVADVIENFYYKGIVNADRDLRTQDFLQYAKFAFGNLLRDMFYRLKDLEEGDEYYYISQNLDRQNFKIKTKGKIKSVDLSSASFIRLPRNRHIFEVAPISENDCNCDDIIQVQPGEERWYKDDEFSGNPFFVVFGEGLDLYHVEDCITEVEVTGFYDKPNMIVSTDLAFDILNIVLGSTLKLKGWPVDVTNNSDSNVKEARSTLVNAAAQTQ